MGQSTSMLRHVKKHEEEVRERLRRVDVDALRRLSASRTSSGGGWADESDDKDSAELRFARDFESAGVGKGRAVGAVDLVHLIEPARSAIRYVRAALREAGRARGGRGRAGTRARSVAADAQRRCARMASWVLPIVQMAGGRATGDQLTVSLKESARGLCTVDVHVAPSNVQEELLSVCSTATREATVRQQTTAWATAVQAAVTVRLDSNGEGESDGLPALFTACTFGSVFRYNAEKLRVVRLRAFVGEEKRLDTLVEFRCGSARAQELRRRAQTAGCACCRGHGGQRQIPLGGTATVGG